MTPDGTTQMQKGLTDDFMGAPGSPILPLMPPNSSVSTATVPCAATSESLVYASEYLSKVTILDLHTNRSGRGHM